MLKYDQSPESGTDKLKTEPRSKVNLMLSLHSVKTKKRKSYCSIGKHSSVKQLFRSQILLYRTVNHSSNQTFNKINENRELSQSNMCISQHVNTNPNAALRSFITCRPSRATRRRSININMSIAGSQPEMQREFLKFNKQKVRNMQL